MEIDAVAAYREALDSLQQTQLQVERMVAIITDGSEKLRNWRRVMISNVSAGFPVDLLAAEAINVADWPTGSQLAEGIAGYHRSRQAAQEAYQRIPPDRREEVTPPPRG
ncbi:MAG: hypothetical protein ACE5Q6_07950 [Dehalococcoidia bacterium]